MTSLCWCFLVTHASTTVQFTCVGRNWVFRNAPKWNASD